ncbi:MAG: anthranilate phosphoribosyltransferase [Acidimicrobiaceae bacterium]|nr:anthranilate phosphoribosyltransferase [Acidimicrobiaceae bacterium]
MVTVTLAELGGWPFILGRLASGGDLSEAEAGAALADVFEGNATPSQLAAFIFGLRCKGETVEEMSGMVQAMLAAAELVPLAPGLGDRVVDTCGTGGDRSGTINVSTIAAFVVAGAGVPVCKHGNRAASSKAGSADLLEALGVAINLGPADVAACVAEAGMGFCFAPRFHPSMRHAGPTRRELGVPTVFNFLGPLANPARTRRQVVGVSDPSMADKMVGVLAANGATHTLVVYGHDGLDELTTTDRSTVVESRVDAEGERHVRTYHVDPVSLGLERVAKAELLGGDAATNADLARRVVAGEKGPRRDIVLLNAAAGLVVAGVAVDLAEGLGIAATVVDDGRAAGRLAQLIEVSQSRARSAQPS